MEREKIVEQQDVALRARVLRCRGQAGRVSRVRAGAGKRRVAGSVREKARRRGDVLGGGLGGGPVLWWWWWPPISGAFWGSKGAEPPGILTLGGGLPG